MFYPFKNILFYFETYHSHFFSCLYLYNHFYCLYNIPIYRYTIIYITNLLNVGYAAQSLIFCYL